MHLKISGRGPVQPALPSKISLTEHIILRNHCEKLRRTTRSLRCLSVLLIGTDARDTSSTSHDGLRFGQLWEVDMYIQLYSGLANGTAASTGHLFLQCAPAQASVMSLSPSVLQMTKTCCRSSIFTVVAHRIANYRCWWRLPIFPLVCRIHYGLEEHRDASIGRKAFGVDIVCLPVQSFASSATCQLIAFMRERWLKQVLNT